MALHRALRFAQKGIENLKVESVARPTRLQPNDAIVQVKAAAINPSDLKNVLGMFPHTTYPRTPGRDFSGVVVEGPAEWVGKEVWGSGSLGIVSDGTHAEYVVVDAGALAEKPSHLSFEAAAAIPVGFVTAWIAMVEKTNVRSNTQSQSCAFYW
jgi:NADPH:quinone reductase-like Zn-dependent oxidoreductase